MPKSHSFDCIISAKVLDDGEDVSVQVFISYSRKDLGFVKQLAGDLKRAGLNVWYDITGLRGGARWGVVLEEAIRSSEFVVLVLSPDSDQNGMNTGYPCGMFGARTCRRASSVTAYAPCCGATVTVAP